MMLSVVVYALPRVNACVAKDVVELGSHVLMQTDIRCVMIIVGSTHAWHTA